MNAAGKNREPIPGPIGTEPHRGDMAPLIRRVRELLATHEGAVTSRQAPLDAESLRRGFGFAGRREGRAEIILSEDVAVELGHPSTASRAVVLSTFDPEIVCHGRISIQGPDLGEMAADRRYPLGQAVLLALRPDNIPDPFDMENTQYLMNRLPGFMVRSVPGKLWVRIGRKARSAGMTLETVGSALTAAYAESFPGVEKVEVVFITSPSSAVEDLARIAAEADILAGRHKKLALGVDGDVECRELNCDVCDDKPVCDNLRDIIVKRRTFRPPE
jgi:CO dehydrogenase/acetyl-CoA synthase beta subunit